MLPIAPITFLLGMTVRKLNPMTEELVKPLNSKSASLGEMISSKSGIYCFML
jgi:hypothetical protein